MTVSLRDSFNFMDDDSFEGFDQEGRGGIYDLPSQTSTHQTFSMVQAPLQWTPSIWSLPMMAFFRVAPFSRMKTASESPPSAWPVQETPRP